MHHAFLNYASGLRVVLEGIWATKTEPGRDNGRSSIRPLQLSLALSQGKSAAGATEGLPLSTPKLAEAKGADMGVS